MATVQKDYYLPRQSFITVGGITQYEFENLTREYECCRATEEGVPVLGMVRALNLDRRKLLEITGGKDATSAAETYDLQHERVLKERILNQTKLGLLIPKEEAKNRARKGLQSVMHAIKYSMKLAAPRLDGITDLREKEAILVDSYNDAIKVLEEEVQLLSWEDDGNTTLLRTRLLSVSEDTEFSRAVNERLKNESNQ
jgi:hypothetical protein